MRTLQLLLVTLLFSTTLQARENDLHRESHLMVDNFYDAMRISYKAYKNRNGGLGEDYLQLTNWLRTHTESGRTVRAHLANGDRRRALNAMVDAECDMMRISRLYDRILLDERDPNRSLTINLRNGEDRFESILRRLERGGRGRH